MIKGRKDKTKTVSWWLSTIITSILIIAVTRTVAYVNETCNTPFDAEIALAFLLIMSIIGNMCIGRAIYVAINKWIEED